MKLHHWRVFTSSLRFSFGVLLFTERFQIGDIGLSARNVIITRVTACVRARDFLDTAQFHFFNFSPNLLKSTFRPRQHTRDTTARSSRRSFRAFDSVFHVLPNVRAYHGLYDRCLSLRQS